jgi:hypothetical protein
MFNVQCQSYRLTGGVQLQVSVCGDSRGNIKDISFFFILGMLHASDKIQNARVFSRMKNSPEAEPLFAEQQVMIALQRLDLTRKKKMKKSVSECSESNRQPSEATEEQLMQRPTTDAKRQDKTNNVPSSSACYCIVLL